MANYTFAELGRAQLLAAESGAFLGAIYGEEEKAKQLGLRGEALRAYRREHIAPIAAAFCDWMDRVQPSLLPSDPLAAAIRYYENHKAALLRFRDDPDLPIDNSPTEREFQNVAKLRLNALFAGSSEGAHSACELLGIAATCRALGISALRYMTWAFERLGTHRDLYGLTAAEVTPAAFAAAHSPIHELPGRPMTDEVRPRIPASLIGQGARLQAGHHRGHARRMTATPSTWSNISSRPCTSPIRGLASSWLSEGSCRPDRRAFRKVTPLQVAPLLA